MKMWVKDHFGKPNYGYDQYEIVNGRRKKIKEHIFTIPSAEGQQQRINLYAFLKIVEQAEQRYGELRNIEVCWSFHEGSRDVGAYHADYDPGWTRFWIEFERLESDAEEVKREGGKISKVKEVKNLLAKQLAKYVKEN